MFRARARARTRALALALAAWAVAGAAALPARPLAAPHGDSAAGGDAVWLGPRVSPAPRRIVSLAPSLTDMMVALGKARLLVGVSRYDHEPAVAALPRVGGFLDPSPEAVLALRPDLLLWITDGGAAQAVERIAALGVPVLALPVQNVADVKASLRLIARALGDAPAGERAVAAIEAAVAGARRGAAARGPPLRVLFVVGRDPLVVAGPGSYPDELLRMAGAENVVREGRAWPVYPLERAVADDPTLVIDGAALEPPQGISRLAAIPAVRRGAVYRMKDDAALRPGPRLVQALAELGAALRQGRDR